PARSRPHLRPQAADLRSPRTPAPGWAVSTTRTGDAGLTAASGALVCEAAGFEVARAGVPPLPGQQGDAHQCRPCGSRLRLSVIRHAKRTPLFTFRCAAAKLPKSRVP